MRDFAAFRWNPAKADAERGIRLVRSRLCSLDPAWTVRIDRPGWLVAERTGAGQKLQIAENGRTLLAGGIFGKDGAPAFSLPVHGNSATGSVASLCKQLMQQFWGAYCLVQMEPDLPDVIAIARDPIGMTDCVSWLFRDIRIVSSRPADLLPHSRPQNSMIDRDVVAQLLAFPGSVAGSAPITGIDTVRPGALTRYSGHTREIIPLWQASSFCRTQSPPDPDRLGSVVAHCIGRWVSGHEGLITELSGGLDSAIVTACSSARPDRYLGAFHFDSGDSAGAERHFAQGIAEHLNIPLTISSIPPTAFSAADLAGMPIGLRPGLGSTSLFHDRMLAAEAEKAGAHILMTGHGGDSVFFQHPAREIAADPRTGSVGDRMKGLVPLGLWTGQSYWQLVRQALFRRPSGEGEISTDPFLAFRMSRPPDPFLEDSGDLPPAKQLQLQGLAAARSAFGPSWCSETLTVLHPLLSQPIVEHVLGISAWDLTGGRRDRLLARQAFTGRLPRDLVRRRGKGALTSHFGRRLARGVPFLRDFLLGGFLAEEGLLDRRTLEQALDPDHLMQFDCYGSLLTMMLVEQWARSWQEQFQGVQGPDASFVREPRQASSQAKTLR